MTIRPFAQPTQTVKVCVDTPQAMERSGLPGEPAAVCVSAPTQQSSRLWRLRQGVQSAAAAGRATLESLRAASTPPAAASQAHTHAVHTTPLPPLLSLEVLLDAPHADLHALRCAVLRCGCDEPRMRLEAWRLLLGVAPMRRDARDAALCSQRANYARLAEELIILPKSCCSAEERDHPLALGSDSVWQRHFRDAELREQVARDVERTQRDLNFFSAASAGPVRSAQCRALFLFAATNAGVYVQGMNELLAPFLFLCSSAGCTLADAEADSFHLFCALLAELRDLFCASLDGSAGGVAGTLTRLTHLIRVIDPQLAVHMESQGLHPQYFAFRWITCAFTQEFTLPDATLVWDGLFAAVDGPLEALLRVAAALVVRQREHLLSKDFASNLKMLQAVPPTDVTLLLRVAQAMPAAPPACVAEPFAGGDSEGEEEEAVTRAEAAWAGFQPRGRRGAAHVEEMQAVAGTAVSPEIL